MSFPPDLLDELARAFARAALDQFLKQQPARGPRQEDERNDHALESPPPQSCDVAEGKADG